MWQRRTFHDCAAELRDISQRFVSAYTNSRRWDEAKRRAEMLDSSQRGVEVLQILALSIRSEQDVGLTTYGASKIGAYKANLSREEATAAVRDYRPPYNQLRGYSGLKLRAALSKIAHANPEQSGFFAAQGVHDLILTGEDHGLSWVAVVSLLDLCSEVQRLPDRMTSHQQLDRLGNQFRRG